MRTAVAAVSDFARSPRSQSPGAAEQLACDLIETRAENFRLEADTAGLRKALESLRADMDLAKDLGAKADAVREECAQAAEARGYKALAKELRCSVTDSQRRVTDGQA